MPAIEQTFGRELVAKDGALDRAAMRRLVFADAAQRQRLEALLHPLIRAAGKLRVEAAWATGAPYALMVIPLLVESGRRQDQLDRVAVVDCPEELQVARVMARSGLAEAEVRAIMATQASRAARRQVADDVIVNDGDLTHLHNQVAALHVNYCALADKIRAGG
jgi:dephospho-CoA kinase